MTKQNSQIDLQINLIKILQVLQNVQQVNAQVFGSFHKSCTSGIEFCAY